MTHIGILIVLCSCSLLSSEDEIIDNGDGITINFLDGLNEDPEYQLSKNSDGYYELTLNRDQNQTIQRISGRLLRDDEPIVDLWSGPQPKTVEFTSNLYWWLLEGDTVANVTYTYLNEFTGELTYVNLPPLVNWRDVLVPTVNSPSKSDSETGVFNTVIAPIQEMKGDTMKLVAKYSHTITSKEEGSNSFSMIGTKIFSDSVYIVFN